MPHLILEHHSDLSDQAIAALLPKLTQCVADTHPSFKRSDCKARAIRFPVSCIGDGTQSNHLVHLQVSILDGRPESVLSQLTERLYAYLETELRICASRPALSVWVTEMNRAHYKKSSTPA